MCERVPIKQAAQELGMSRQAVRTHAEKSI